MENNELEIIIGKIKDGYKLMSDGIKKGSKLLDEGLIALELEKSQKEQTEQDTKEKISTGVRRLDDMLFGGLPKGSNAFVYGPPFTGKATLLNLFIADGLKKGNPCTYILSDKSAPDVREELEEIIPQVRGYEEKGLLKFVDAYSKSMGSKADEPGVTYIEHNAGNFDKFSDEMYKAVENRLKDGKNHKLALRSVSTIMAYNDIMNTFRFLQRLTFKNKSAKATALYHLDAGMFKDSEVQTLKHLMNGVIETKSEDLRNYLRVEGLADARTRGWIEYSYNNKSMSLKGTFAVDHIR